MTYLFITIAAAAVSAFFHYESSYRAWHAGYLEAFRDGQRFRRLSNKSKNDLLHGMYERGFQDGEAAAERRANVSGRSSSV